MHLPVVRRLLSALFISVFAATAFGADDLARWQQQAAQVTIYRDTWGIAHVYGRTDADAVFGMLYAQAEDDFHRIEMNYIDAVGRRAEVVGESEIYRDLRMKLFIDPVEMQAKFAASPAWLQKLMTAFADGLNYYLHTHPAVRPKLITRFEPWMALTFSEGSIGGDIEDIDLAQLAQLYGTALTAPPPAKKSAAAQEPGGSNGFAIAPALSASGHALLLINPHTSFYFRPEIHVVSEEGLNAYGAVTWGQFFIYQGFSDRAGWMHTSGGGDGIDEFAEKITATADGFTYRHGDRDIPLRAKKITLPYRDGDKVAEKIVTAYFSHHGPIVREADGRWLSVSLMNEPVKALSQSFLRTKARNYAEFSQVMELRTNSSNNTVYADADGNIAYFHGNFIPVRDTRFDYTRPVDGSNPAADWQGLHDAKDTIRLLNPANGWIQNTNNWPFSAAGPYSPRPQDFPVYMSKHPENARGIHAVRVLENRRDFTLDSLIATAYDNLLTAFEPLLPSLLKAYDDTPGADPLKRSLAEPIAVLRAWDYRSSVDSVPTALAIFWAQELMSKSTDAARKTEMPVLDYMAWRTTTQQRLDALTVAVAKLQKDFGHWKTPWGEINRFQRLDGSIDAKFDDDKPSLPIGFASSTWGSLAAFGISAPTATRKIYGTKGNSFVAVVEFGPRVKAKTSLAGGVSGDPASPYFFNQAADYAPGKFKDVLYYREDVEKNAQRSYHPGQ